MREGLEQHHIVPHHIRHTIGEVDTEDVVTGHTTEVKDEVKALTDSNNKDMHSTMRSHSKRRRIAVNLFVLGVARKDTWPLDVEFAWTI